jgi:hypothetical protein
MAITSSFALASSLLGHSVMHSTKDNPIGSLIIDGSKLSSSKRRSCSAAIASTKTVYIATTAAVTSSVIHRGNPPCGQPVPETSERKPRLRTFAEPNVGDERTVTVLTNTRRTLLYPICCTSRGVPIEQISMSTLPAECRLFSPSASSR